MTVGIKIGSIISEIGTGEFFDSFFGTIHHNLESDKWGTRFPTIMNELYQGKLPEEKAKNALVELKVITDELEKLPPEKVIWDINNLDVKPPWGDSISDDITNLSNYFVTSTGRDLIGTIKETLESSEKIGGTVEIVSY